MSRPRRLLALALAAPLVLASCTAEGGERGGDDPATTRRRAAARTAG